MDAAPKSLPGEIPPSAASPFSPTRTIRLVGLTLCLGYLIVLGGTFLKGDFLLDAQGRPIANDFVNVAAAGRVALDGEPAAAYDWPTPQAGRSSRHRPRFCELLRLALSAAVFVRRRGAGDAALCRRRDRVIAGDARRLCRGAVRHSRPQRNFCCAGFPAALWNVTAGQNGFLTAALIGGTLGLLERRPALAGVCLGLLTYKPQFGLLFPFALIADRRWTTILVAAATAIALAALSWLAFGSASWQAFVHWMPITSRIVLGEGHADFDRLQSVFGSDPCRMAAARRWLGAFKWR